jgi:hypothetical protein
MNSRKVLVYFCITLLLYHYALLILYWLGLLAELTLNHLLYYLNALLLFGIIISLNKKIKKKAIKITIISFIVLVDIQYFHVYFSYGYGIAELLILLSVFLILWFRYYMDEKMIVIHRDRASIFPDDFFKAVAKHRSEADNEEMLEIDVKMLDQLETEIKIQLPQFKCVVHRGNIDGTIYVCPRCKTLYCERCSSVLAKNGETCWYCSSTIQITM